MRCRECSSNMYLFDKVSNKSGLKEKYYVCSNCQTGCIAFCRGKSVFRELWHSENGNSVKNYVLNF